MRQNLKDHGVPLLSMLASAEAGHIHLKARLVMYSDINDRCTEELQTIIPEDWQALRASLKKVRSGREW